MGQEDQDDKNRRRMGVRDAFQLLMLILTVAAIIWRGGEMTNQLSVIGTAVVKIENRLESAFEKQAKAAADIQVLQDRSIVSGERLQNHEGRIVSLESARRARE